MQRLTIRGLQALLLLLGLLSLVIQYGIVQVGIQEPMNPLIEGLRVPFIVGTVLFVVCAQVVLVCVWVLLSMVASARIFSERAFRYVDIIIGAVLGATVLIGLFFVTLIWLDKVTFANMGYEDEVAPGIVLLVLVAGMIGTGLTLLVVVMRGLLRKASQLEQDLAEVV